MRFDEDVLDDAEALARRDDGRLLWSLATAGAQVRRTLDWSAEFGVERLRGDDPPRALLVAGDVPFADELITSCARERTAALTWPGVELPRWSGPADALVVAGLDGCSPRLTTLAEQADRRGLALAVVAPSGSPLAAAAGRAPLHELPRDLHPRAARWSVLAPLLQALDALAVCAVPPSLLIEIADALDEQAERCRPSGDAFTNPAKSLAAEFAEDLPLIVGAGELAGVAARTVAGTLSLLTGRAAPAATLPDELDLAVSVVRAAHSPVDEPDDFFRDRVEDAAAARPRLLVIGDDGSADDPLLGDRSTAALQLGEVGARRSAAALRDLASGAGVRVSSVDVPQAEPLARFAAATAFGDFTAAYLALGLGLGTDGVRP